MKSLTIYEAQHFIYPFGVAIIQQGRGEMDTVLRVWENVPQAWWDIPIHLAYEGMADTIYRSWLNDEQRVHKPYDKLN